MRLIASALLAIFAAVPVAEILPSTPLGPIVAKLQQSPEVLGLFGDPSLLCLAIYLLFCCGVTEILLTGLAVVAAPRPFHIKAGEALPWGHGPGHASSAKGVKENENRPRPKGFGG